MSAPCCNKQAIPLLCVYVQTLNHDLHDMTNNLRYYRGSEPFHYHRRSNTSVSLHLPHLSVLNACTKLDALPSAFDYSTRRSVKNCYQQADISVHFLRGCYPSSCALRIKRLDEISICVSFPDERVTKIMYQGAWCGGEVACERARADGEWLY